MTALLVATYWGHKDVVEYLLQKGADPNMQEKDGMYIMRLGVNFMSVAVRTQ